MRGTSLILWLTLALAPQLSAAAPVVETEKTYWLGGAQSPVVKSYAFCRLLTVEMRPHDDGSFEFAYRVKDDSGKALEKESRNFIIRTGELESFIKYCEQAWDWHHNLPKPIKEGPVWNLGRYSDGYALFIKGMFGDELLIAWRDDTPEKRAGLDLQMDWLCATLSLLSRTAEGNKFIHDARRFQDNLRKEPTPMTYKEQEEIDLSTSIVRKYSANNWDTWEGWITYGNLDFRKLSGDEIRYISFIFGKDGPEGRTQYRMDGDTAFIVRLKLNNADTLTELREAFHAGYLPAYSAAEACRTAANPKLMLIAAEFLDQDKAPKVIPPDDDVSAEPSPSIHAANAVRDLLAVCPEFPEVVRASAKSWQRMNLFPSNALVDPCRTWWKENRERIGAGHYDEVTPLPPKK